MEKRETKTAVKSLYLQAAALAGFEVSPDSPERLSDIVEEAFDQIVPQRRAESVANLLKLLAAIIDTAGRQEKSFLNEQSVEAGKAKVCPIYPFGK